jgi:hypothetical protein
MNAHHRRRTGAHHRDPPAEQNSVPAYEIEDPTGHTTVLF